MKKIFTVLFLIFTAMSISLYSQNEKDIIEKYIYENENYIPKQTDIIGQIGNALIAKVIIEENWFECLYIFDFSGGKEKPAVKKLSADDIIDSVNIIEINSIGKVIEVLSHTHSGNGFIKLIDMRGKEVFSAKFYDSHYENESFILYEGKYKDGIQTFFKDADDKYISKIFDKDSGYRLNIKYNYDGENGILIYGRVLYMLSNEDESEVENVYYEDIKEYYIFDKTKKEFRLVNTFIISSAVNVRPMQDEKIAVKDSEYAKADTKRIFKIIEAVIFIAVVVLFTIRLIYVISGLLKMRIGKQSAKDIEKNKKIVLKKIEDLMSEGINAATSKDINIGFEIWPEGTTALMLASYYDYKNIASLLIEKLSDVNKKNQEGQTALMFACEWCNTEIVKMLIDAKADVNIKDKYSQNALIHLVYPMPDGEKAKEIAGMLIKSGIDINAKTEEKENALTISSLDKSLTDVSKMLIDSHIDINAENEDGITALMNAAMNGNDEIADLLIRRGCNINAKDESGCTALMHAVLAGRTETVKLLIEQKANMNIKNNIGETVFDIDNKRITSDMSKLLKSYKKI